MIQKLSKPWRVMHFWISLSKTQKSCHPQVSRKNTNFGTSGSDTGGYINVKMSSRKFWFWHFFSCHVSWHSEVHTFRLGFFIKLKALSKLVQHLGKSVKTQFPRAFLFLNPQVRRLWNWKLWSFPTKFSNIDGQASRCFRTMGTIFSKVSFSFFSFNFI